jgi:hypothetical protein
MGWIRLFDQFTIKLPFSDPMLSVACLACSIWKGYCWEGDLLPLLEVQPLMS